MSVGKNMQACFMLYVHCMAELLYIEWRYEDMIKVIASDMDGTLLCDDHRIAPDTIAAVKEACAAGIRFMVATGRGYEGAMAELDGTGIVCDYILGSGAEVRDPQRKIVKECGIGMELCREICEEVKGSCKRRCRLYTHYFCKQRSCKLFRYQKYWSSRPRCYIFSYYG